MPDAVAESSVGLSLPQVLNNARKRWDDGEVRCLPAKWQHLARLVPPDEGEPVVTRLTDKKKLGETRQKIRLANDLRYLCEVMPDLVRSIHSVFTDSQVSVDRSQCEQWMAFAFLCRYQSASFDAAEPISAAENIW